MQSSIPASPLSSPRTDAISFAMSPLKFPSGEGLASFPSPKRAPRYSAPLSELDANTPCSRTGDLPPLPACSPSAGQMQGAGRCSADTLWGHVRRSNPFGCSHDWAGDTPGAPPADERLLPPALTEAPSSRGFAWDAASETHRGDPGVASDPEAPLQGSPALPDIGAVCATPAIGDAAMGRDNERAAWSAESSPAMPALPRVLYDEQDSLRDGREGHAPVRSLSLRGPDSGVASGATTDAEGGPSQSSGQRRRRAVGRLGKHAAGAGATEAQAQALREALERELRRQSSADVPSRTRRNVLRATGDGPRATNDSCDGSEGGGTGVGASRRTSRGSCDECGCYSTSMAPLSMAQAQGRDLDRMSTTPGDGDGGGRAPAAGTAAAVSRGWGAGTDSLGSGVTVSESGVSTCEGGAGAEAGALVGVRWLRAQVHAAGMREDQGRRGSQELVRELFVELGRIRAQLDDMQTRAVARSLELRNARGLAAAPAGPVPDDTTNAATAHAPVPVARVADMAAPIPPSIAPAVYRDTATTASPEIQVACPRVSGSPSVPTAPPARAGHGCDGRNENGAVGQDDNARLDVSQRQGTLASSAAAMTGSALAAGVVALGRFKAALMALAHKVLAKALALLWKSMSSWAARRGATKLLPALPSHGAALKRSLGLSTSLGTGGAGSGVNGTGGGGGGVGGVGASVASPAQGDTSVAGLALARGAARLSGSLESCLASAWAAGQAASTTACGSVEGVAGWVRGGARGSQGGALGAAVLGAVAGAVASQLLLRWAQRRVALGR